MAGILQHTNPTVWDRDGLRLPSLLYCCALVGTTGSRLRPASGGPALLPSALPRGLAPCTCLVPPGLLSPDLCCCWPSADGAPGGHDVARPAASGQASPGGEAAAVLVGGAGESWSGGRLGSEAGAAAVQPPAKARQGFGAAAEAGRGVQGPPLGPSEGLCPRPRGTWICVLCRQGPWGRLRAGREDGAGLGPAVGHLLTTPRISWFLHFETCAQCLAPSGKLCCLRRVCVGACKCAHACREGWGEPEQTPSRHQAPFSRQRCGAGGLRKPRKTVWPGSVL